MERRHFPESEAGLRGKPTSPEAATLENPLGSATTRDLLEELRLRGDLAMTVTPSTERGADGAVLSAIAGLVLKSSALRTLEAIRGE